MKLAYIRENRIYIETPPTIKPMQYHKLKCDSTSVMYIGFSGCWLSHYLKDQHDRGNISKELAVATPTGVVLQELRGLLSTNAQAVSACLKRNDFHPHEYMTIYWVDPYTGGTDYASCEANHVLQMIGKHGYSLEKNKLGTYIPLRCGVASN